MNYTVEKDKIIIENLSDETIESFLLKHHQSKKNRYLLIRDKHLYLGNEVVKDLHTPINKQPLTILLPQEEIDWPCADEMCDVIYEDAFVYIVHKKPGIIIHNDLDKTNCLMAQAALYQTTNHICSTVRPIHRLDKDTQGLLLFSKITFFQPDLDALLKERKIKRTYLAITKGLCKEGKKFEVNQPIGRDRHQSGRYRISKTGLQARTVFTCIKQEDDLSYFRCELDTGRTHQIRVHLADAGYPIINDPLYGIKHPISNTMGLWAKEIIYTNPLNKKKHKIYDTIKEDIPWEEKDEVRF